MLWGGVQQSFMNVAGRDGRRHTKAKDVTHVKGGNYTDVSSSCGRNPSLLFLLINLSYVL